MREYAKKYGGVAFQKARKREEREAKAVLLCYGFSSNSKKKKKICLRFLYWSQFELKNFTVLCHDSCLCFKLKPLWRSPRVVLSFFFSCVCVYVSFFLSPRFLF